MELIGRNYNRSIKDDNNFKGTATKNNSYLNGKATLTHYLRRNDSDISWTEKLQPVLIHRAFVDLQVPAKTLGGL